MRRNSSDLGREEPLLPGRPPKYSFDATMVRRTVQLTRLQFRPKVTPYPSVLTSAILLIIFSCAKEVAVYYSGNLASEYYAVLPIKSNSAFSWLVGKSLIIVLSTALGNSLVKYFGGVYQVRTRLVLTHYIQSRYVKKGHLYATVVNSLLDNPDQRITQDIDKFARTSAELLRDLIICPILVIYYTYKTWDIAGYLGPVIIYAFFIVGTVITRWLMTPVITRVYAQEKQEGAFRFQHVFTRVNAEAIALQQGEMFEQLALNQSLMTIIHWQWAIIKRKLWLDLSTETFGYLGSIISYLILAIPIFAGKYDHMDPTSLSSLISQTSFINMYLIYQFTTIVQKAAVLSDFAGFVARISQFIETLEEDVSTTPSEKFDSSSDSDEDLNEFPASGRLETQGDSIVVENLSYTLPSGRLLFRNMNFQVNPGQHLLIMGPNGSGKSSLVRLLGGLWTPQTGQITIPEDTPQRTGLMIFPQASYLTMGSLYDQIVYPNPSINEANNYFRHSTFFERLWQRLGIKKTGPRSVNGGIVPPQASQLASTSKRPSLNSLCSHSDLGDLDSGKPATAQRASHYTMSGDTSTEVNQSPSNPAKELITDNQLFLLLNRVGLDRVARTIPFHQTFQPSEWSQLLSPGETQKLLFARLLYFKPRFAVMDESTAAVDAFSSVYLYEEAQKEGITLLTISHNDVLKPFHRNILSFNNDGTISQTVISSS
ncbi:hypothetical protein IWQ62_005137 [Dispira parvispora]|uniref:Uncharacterized protein n=1 Tax=Dispira parvispora TaxID=1520584 RepID=A0A9W8DZY6_9FUNG|nr:hypothetical protein IWQ62_005137 [Dispira parvispora]